MAGKIEIKGPGPVPEDALGFFSRKQLRPGFDYRDVWRQEHAYAFTVAKATELDVLSAIDLKITQAISNGITLRQFQKELQPALEELGWWGRKTMVDQATGEIKKVQLGSPRRLKTIYETNMRTAHAAGQWQRAERTKDALPYLLRTLGPSREHRPEHIDWHGTLLPLDDSWWDTHVPPNGYGCKCRVRQVSRTEYDRLQKNGLPAADRKQVLNPETGLPTGHLEKKTQPARTKAPKIYKKEWINKRTGEVEMVPEGIDPGWDTNPGKTRQANMNKFILGKLAGADPVMAKVARKDLDAYRKIAGEGSNYK